MCLPLTAANGNSKYDRYRLPESGSVPTRATDVRVLLELSSVAYAHRDLPVDHGGSTNTGKWASLDSNAPS